MNCKPGDLAIYVACDGTAIPQNDGRLFKVMRRDVVESLAEGCLWWEVSVLCRAFNSDREWVKTGELGSCADAHLRPIRPGDISDEEVRDLYAPKLPEVA